MKITQSELARVSAELVTKVVERMKLRTLFASPTDSSAWTASRSESSRWAEAATRKIDLEAGGNL